MENGGKIKVEKGVSVELTTERLARELQEKLTQFASFGTKEREKTLPELTGFIEANAKEPIVQRLVDKEFEDKLKNAVEHTLATKFRRQDGSIVEDIWEGEYTVTALSEDGKIMGALSKPGKVWELYGDLNKYGLIKALCELHLYKVNRFEGLSDPDNFKYLVGLGLRPVKPDDESFEPNLFTGSATGVNVDGKVIYIAGSGCWVNRGYLGELLAGATPGIDTQAGLFEKTFSRITGSYLQNSGQEAQILPEPREIQQLRINN